MNKIKKLESGKLHIMIGLPASGKSTVLKESTKLPRDWIVSSDDMRENLFGRSFSVFDGKTALSPNHFADNQVFELIYKIVDVRLQNRLTTVLDIASMVSASERKKFYDMAAKYGVDVQEWYFENDLTNALKYNNQRATIVPEESIRSFAEKYKYDELSKNAIKISHDVRFEPVINQKNVLPHGKYDIIGDIHGLYSDFILMLDQMGYKKDNAGVFRHPDGRNLLLLGDFLDRGQENMEMLEFVYKQLKNTDDKAIMGNHENKLLNFLRFMEKGKVVALSPSASLTASQFMKLDKDVRKKYEEMLINLPYYFVYNNIAFVHANLDYFNPLSTPASYLMYGDARKNMSFEKLGLINNDENYARLYDEGANSYYLVRGHIGSQSKEQNKVLSLEAGQAFDGYLAGVKLEDLVVSIAAGKGVNNDEIVNRFKTVSRFNFDDYAKEHLALYRKMLRLEKEKLCHRSRSEDGMLSIFKYKKDVFFKRKWSENHDLLSCRGIVFDFAGNIVQYPFDKVFNYNEPNENGQPTGANIDANKEFIEVEKLNGFFGAITRHPFKEDLLFSTAGMLTSDFVGYIKDMVKKDGVYGDLMKYTSKHPDITLMFEVIHPEDPHIVEYSLDECGVYLIGARKKELNSKLFTELELDEIAKEVGLRRASWQIKKFKDIVASAKTTNAEGFMVRDVNTGETVLKLKSTHYLLVKFLGRLSDKKVKHMFSNPESFKSGIDEEFFDIVDKLVVKTTMDDFLGMSEDDRKVLVRSIIESGDEKKCHNVVKRGF